MCVFRNSPTWGLYICVGLIITYKILLQYTNKIYIQPIKHSNKYKPSVINMDDYIEEFLFTKSKLTQIHYTSDLKYFRKWLKENNIPEDVTRIRFLDVQRYLKTVVVSPSRRRKIITLKSFFHYLHLNDYITKDILKCLKVPPATKCRVERKMTEEEVYGILKKARGKVKLLVQCLFFLGLLPVCIRRRK